MAEALKSVRVYKKKRVGLLGSEAVDVEGQSL